MWLCFISILYLWEYIELQLELGKSYDAITYWMGGVEHSFNRWIFDPLLAFLGAALYLTMQPKLITVLSWKIISLIFLAVHILILPHSMAISDYING